MRKIIIAITSTGTLLGTIALAEAMPLANVAPTYSSEITQVRFGCGPGFHPNPFNRCVPNGFGPRFYGRPGFRVGPGFHRGPGFYRGPGYRRGEGFRRF